MRFVKPLLALCLAAAVLGGCARAARDTTGFALNDSVTVEAPFEETWQAVKHVLRDRELVIDTRDKRGRFVAFDTKRSNLFRNTRTRYTIELSEISDVETAVHVETLREVYGTTLLTEPDWHARPTKDDAESKAIIQALMAKINGQEMVNPEALDAQPAEESAETADPEEAAPDSPDNQAIPTNETPVVEDASNV